LSLVGETINGFYISHDMIHEINKAVKYSNKEESRNITPEDFSRACCVSFLEEVYYVKILIKFFKKVWSY
jgi:hypothetical protein